MDEMGYSAVNLLTRSTALCGYPPFVLSDCSADRESLTRVGRLAISYLYRSPVSRQVAKCHMPCVRSTYSGKYGRSLTVASRNIAQHFRGLKSQSEWIYGRRLVGWIV